jgi:DNA-binding transcriptional LysR family regulator
MRKELNRMAIFAKVVELGSFSGAATALQIGNSVVSHHVTALEKSAGIQLLNRNTRSLALTEEGRRFYENCQRMMDAAKNAFTDVHSHKGSPRGTVRVTAPYNLGVSFLSRCFGGFHDLYPGIDFDLVLDDSIVNLIEEGFDLALRVGWLAETRMQAVRLASFSMVPCATPAFLKKHGTPRKPEDLAGLPWVSITQLSHPQRLTLESRSSRRRTVRLNPAIRTNTGIAARQLILEGKFTGVVPDYSVKNELAKGTLIRLLPDWRSREGAISAVFPHRDHLPTKTRVLIDFLKAEFRKHYG